MFPSSAITSKLYLLLGGRTELVPRLSFWFQLLALYTHTEILSDCSACEEVLGDLTQRNVSFFKKTGEECEEIRAGSSLSLVGDGHSLVRRRNLYLKYLHAP